MALNDGTQTIFCYVYVVFKGDIHCSHPVKGQMTISSWGMPKKIPGFGGSFVAAILAPFSLAYYIHACHLEIGQL